MNDQLLALLYSTWSEHTYRASWVAPNENDYSGFRDWLIVFLETPLEDYEQEALPRLRAIWSEMEMVDANTDPT